MMLQAVLATVLRKFKMPRALNGQVGLLTPVWALSTEAIMPQWHITQEEELQSFNSAT